jgi:hypothetical protein
MFIISDSRLIPLQFSLSIKLSIGFVTIGKPVTGSIVGSHYPVAPVPVPYFLTFTVFILPKIY